MPGRPEQPHFANSQEVLVEFNIAVLGGDGIGPEVTDQGVRVLEAVGRAFGHTFNLSYGDIGGISIDKHGTPLTDETIGLLDSNDAVLFGAVGGPKWDSPDAKVRPEMGLLDMRAHMGVFANIRPVKVYSQLVESSVLKPDIVTGVDLVVVRELTGGLYYAEPRGRRETPNGIVAEDTMRYTEGEIERVVRVGFELARGRRKKLASVDKANVLECSRLWRTVATRLAAEYPDVELEHVLVDACAMQLIQRPIDYDVIVAENTFGDILSDEASMLAASMGLLPSASLAGVPVAGMRSGGLYEPIHGTAPDIAGKGIANPTGSILSVALMVRYSLGLTEEGAAIELAVDQVLGQNVRTADIVTEGTQQVSTVEMGDRVVAAIEQGS
ncbi:MAG: 3-isopropylmalate dehydrogenase [SAR202 cluster bacterium]|nr:3-isopropylmalate dehydrogenase [SAR202 cluster bacterium]MQG33139.1 3-isopropylmalate dehydrogenase [SAR202 cluster bacterium]HAA95494.1 3-isopropylmalate dehydrogenase [Dehalococcoidia bacterium]HCL24922.1 3-isopropylmalate dehydrogenase [Dehalococcoidia bacterium]HCP23125.1 3-isopropylmalate dehydrogenase [Dehalococcoidia bacterium]|tara:strand:- start:2408 stop:3559 length:1152 start_codon:yes stop_codon:yes gene_type:complete